MADKCYFCDEEVDQGSYCYGCHQYVCDECDLNLGLMGRHSVDDHQIEEDYE